MGLQLLDEAAKFYLSGSQARKIRARQVAGGLIIGAAHACGHGLQVERQESARSGSPM